MISAFSKADFHIFKSADRVIIASMVFSRPSGRIGPLFHASLVIAIMMVPSVLATSAQAPDRAMDAGFTAPAMWPVYGHDSQRTSRTDQAGPAAPLRRWSVTAAPRTQNGAPIVIGSEGTVYVGSDAGLISIDPQTGVMKTFWQLQGWSVYAVAILSDGTIIAGANYRVGTSLEHGTVFGLSPAGIQKWDLTLSGNIYNQIAISKDENIYVLTHHGPLYAISSTGSLKWMKQASGSYGGVALARDDTVYASTETNLTAYHPDGQPIWSIPVWVDAQLVVQDDGTILAVGYQCGSGIGFCNPVSVRTLFALNPNRTTRWSLESPSSPPSLGWDGTIYASYNHDIRALNSDGTKRWNMTLNTAGYYTSGIVDANNVLYVYSDDGITGITSGGHLWWTVRDVGYPVGIGADGTLYYYYFPDGLVSTGLVGALAATDFVVTANPNSFTLISGQKGFSTVTVTPRFGFSGTVTLSSKVSPSGPVISLASSSVPGGSGNVAMTIDVGGALPIGTYVINVTGSSGYLAHSSLVSVIVTHPQATLDSSLLGLSTGTLFMLAVGAATVVVAALATVVILKRRKNTRV